MAAAPPYGVNSKRQKSLFENLTAYKNRNGGFRRRGELFVVRNLKTADNAIGYTISTGSIGDDEFTSLAVGSLFVGETENIGNPTTPEEIAYGRTLPKRLIPDFPTRGYDYRLDVVNTTFVNFQDNEQCGAGALSWLLFTGAGVATENTVTGAKYIDAKPVYFPNIDPRFDSDTGIQVKTARPEVSLSLSEMAKDFWVVFALPGFASADSGKQQDSLHALRKATETSYFKGSDAVWVKLVIPTTPRALAEINLGRWILRRALR